ncbi:hypothetical protein SAMN04488134_105166 [Amphibacillus marinus]|uniref:Uncharacterized protein n=1 Tax=Amphibacillus marinus TaxID=872970 RepID=A0A1H8N8E3_9BACI|nr:hypothetical protein [Amphibacillus marinus]SEO25981.1 hypothetical protein SAMN04488134_105166 [Amphibacillus marinus]
MLKQLCNLLIVHVYDDEDFKEEVALLYSLTSQYYLKIPSRHILETKKIKGKRFVISLKDAFFIQSHEVKKRMNDIRRRE